MERDLIAARKRPDAILIPNFQSFQSKLQNMKLSGIDNLHLIADYDLTLTRYKINNIPGSTTYKILQDSVLKGENAGYITSLYNYYHPIEIDPNIPIEEKTRFMNEWWEKSNQAILDEGFNRSDLPNFINGSNIFFRSGLREFANHLNQKEIPLIIISGGIGNLIEVSFNNMIKNLKIFSNFIGFDNSGRSEKFLQPEVRNDKSRIIEHEAVKKNIILLGDLPGDTKMTDSVSFENCLKIGFLNNAETYDIKNYENLYDVLVMHDGDLHFVNYLLSFISNEDVDWDSYSDFKWVHEQVTGLV